MKITFLLLSIIIGVSSCNNKNIEDKQEVESKLTLKEFYLTKMHEKNFQLIKNGQCDDALMDTIHERSVAYIDSKLITDTNTVIEFKFISSCCQEFLGDYTIENDTLQFLFENTNEMVCSCLCWYRYKLVINEPRSKFKEIEIKKLNKKNKPTRDN